MLVTDKFRHFVCIEPSHIKQVEIYLAFHFLIAPQDNKSNSVSGNKEMHWKSEVYTAKTSPNVIVMRKTDLSPSSIKIGDSLPQVKRF